MRLTCRVEGWLVEGQLFFVGGNSVEGRRQSTVLVATLRSLFVSHTEH